MSYNDTIRLAKKKLVLRKKLKVDPFIFYMKKIPKNFKSKNSDNIFYKKY